MRLPFSIIGLLAISTVSIMAIGQEAIGQVPIGPKTSFTFNKNIGYFYISKVTLQLTESQEICIVGNCGGDGGVKVEVFGNSPSCSNSTIDGWVRVTFRSEDNQAYFIRHFKFTRKSEENQSFSRSLILNGYYGDLDTGNVSVATSTQCLKKLIKT